MAKRKIIFSPRAKLDLWEILDFYYRRNGTIIYSKKLNAQIHNAINSLKDQAYIGVATKNKNIRNLIIGNYCIFYRINPEEIEIITIWDSRQNPDKLKID